MTLIKTQTKAAKGSVGIEEFLVVRHSHFDGYKR